MSDSKDYREAEQQVFPPVPDDKVWCALRGTTVDANDCATDACVAPEMRHVCWLGRDAFFGKVGP